LGCEEHSPFHTGAEEKAAGGGGVGEGCCKLARLSSSAVC
jgi:hypothetical protein